MCAIVTLVGVEHIIESISRKLIELIRPRPSGAWENCEISVRCFLRVQMSAENDFQHAFSINDDNKIVLQRVEVRLFFFVKFYFMWLRGKKDKVNFI